MAAPRVTRRARAAATATCRPISDRRQSSRGRRLGTPGTAARSRRVVVRCAGAASSPGIPKPEEAARAARCVRRAVHGRAGTGAPRTGKPRPTHCGRMEVGAARARAGVGVTGPAHFSRPFPAHFATVRRVRRGARRDDARGGGMRAAAPRPPPRRSHPRVHRGRPKGRAEHFRGALAMGAYPPARRWHSSSPTCGLTLPITMDACSRRDSHPPRDAISTDRRNPGFSRSPRRDSADLRAEIQPCDCTDLRRTSSSSRLSPTRHSPRSPAGSSSISSPRSSARGSTDSAQTSKTGCVLHARPTPRALASPARRAVCARCRRSRFSSRPCCRSDCATTR